MDPRGKIWSDVIKYVQYARSTRVISCRNKTALIKNELNTNLKWFIWVVALLRNYIKHKILIWRHNIDTFCPLLTEAAIWKTFSPQHCVDPFTLCFFFFFEQPIGALLFPEASWTERSAPLKLLIIKPRWCLKGVVFSQMVPITARY